MLKKVITIIIVLVVVGGAGWWLYKTSSEPTGPGTEGSKECVSDSDCVVFGETGDCNCGCYNKDNLPSDTGGECFCQAPTSCKCVNAQCEGVFEEEPEEITSFEECVAKGYDVMESYPRKCRTSAGETFIEDIGNVAEKIDLIRIDTPRPNDLVESPLLIEGEARGTWFFEGDFPVELLDGNGNVIATAIARAEGEWMTEDFVAFKAEIEFEMPETNKGNLILKKDNPSDLRELDDELRVPVRFK